MVTRIHPPPPRQTQRTLTAKQGEWIMLIFGGHSELRVHACTLCITLCTNLFETVVLYWGHVVTNCRILEANCTLVGLLIE